MGETSEVSIPQVEQQPKSTRALMDGAGHVLHDYAATRQAHVYKSLAQRIWRHLDPIPVTYLIDEGGLQWEGITQGNREMMNKPYFDRIVFSNTAFTRPNGKEETANVALTYHQPNGEVVLERGGLGMDISNNAILLTLEKHIEAASQRFQGEQKPKVKTAIIKDRQPA